MSPGPGLALQAPNFDNQRERPCQCMAGPKLRRFQSLASLDHSHSGPSGSLQLHLALSEPWLIAAAIESTCRAYPSTVRLHNTVWPPPLVLSPHLTGLSSWCNLRVVRFDLHLTLRAKFANLPGTALFLQQVRRGPLWVSHESDLMRYALLAMHGGVYGARYLRDTFLVMRTCCL